MEGRRILRVEQHRDDLRFPLPERFTERLSGQRIDRVGREAKFLSVFLSGGEVLVMHLGMTGRFTVSELADVDSFAAVGSPAADDHVIFHLEGGERVVYNDRRRFGFMELWPAETFPEYGRLKKLGLDPLSNRFSAAYLDEALKGRAGPIKTALLDQKVIAGLGNIYACEALFRAGISPKRHSRSILGRRAAKLAPALRAVIADAIKAGHVSNSAIAEADDAIGHYPHGLDVYDREGQACKRCRATVRRIVQSGRSTFYCARCQR